MSAVEAAVRKHEAIETDIVAYSERVQAVSAVAAELEAERYHDIRRVLTRRDNVVRLWDFLRQLVAARRERLLLHLELQKMLQDLAHLMDWMEEMKVPAWRRARGARGMTTRRPDPDAAVSPPPWSRRVGCSHRIWGSTCMGWTTCCRSTRWWRPTSRRRRSGCGR